MSPRLTRGRVAAEPVPAVTIVHALPDMKDQLATLGYDLVASTPEEFAHRIQVEIETWRKVIRAAGIKAD